jgi:large subunit ribosomal protein L25
MELSLKANSRDITGKGVKFLRRQGLTPLHLFGHDVASLALQSETTKVEKSLSQAGETRLISLTIDKERKTRPVLVREIQRDPISGRLIHVDLYQVKMDERVQVEVPIILVGKAPALETKNNTIQQELNSLDIEAFPGKIPAAFKVDVSSLAEAGQLIRVKDLEVDPEIVVTTNAERVVVTIARHEEKVEKLVVEEVAAPVETEPPKEQPAES